MSHPFGKKQQKQSILTPLKKSWWAKLPSAMRSASQRTKEESPRSRRAVMEVFEPRLMMSADGLLDGSEAALLEGLTAVGDEIGALITDNPLFDNYVPGILVIQGSGSDAVEVSPTLEQALSMTADVSKTYGPGNSIFEFYDYEDSGSDVDLAARYEFVAQDFSVLGVAIYGDKLADELVLRALDLDSDSSVSIAEAFNVLVVGQISSFLDNMTNPADQDELVSDVTDFLSGPFGFSAPTSLSSYFDIDVDSANGSYNSDTGTVQWDVDFSLQMFYDARFDLGYEADKLGIITDPGTPPNPNNDPFKLPVVGVIDFGSFQFGLTDADGPSVTSGDFFFAAPDRASDPNDGVRIGISIGSSSDPVETFHNGSFIGINVGFLGTHVYDPSGSPTDSGVVLDMSLFGAAVDPSNVKALGFTDTAGTGTQGVAMISGKVEADTTWDAGTIASTGIQFTLKIGNDPLHNATELTLPAGSYANTTALVTALNTAISGSALNGVVAAADADADDRIEFTLVNSDPSLLGFASELLNAGGLLTAGASSLIGTGKTATTVGFLLRVGKEWKKVTVDVTVDADGADNDPDTAGDNNAITIDSLVANLQTGLNNAGFTATPTAGKNGSNHLTISAGGNALEISHTLTLDTLDRITLADLQASAQIFDMDADSDAAFTVDLALRADADLLKQDGTAYLPEGTIKVDLNPFTPNAVKAVVVDTNPSTGDPVIRASYQLTDAGGVVLKSGTSDLQTMLDFNVINVADILGTFSEIGTWFERLSGTNLLQGFDVPFADSVLGDILNFKDLITDSFLIDDLDNGVKSGTDDVQKLLTWVGDKLLPRFGTAQQLEARLNELLAPLDVDGRVIVDGEGRQNLTYNLSIADVTLDVVPNTPGDQPLVVPLDFELNLDPVANFETSGKLVISATGDVGFTLGVILGNAVDALENSTPLLELNSGAGVKLNTNLALTTLGAVTPLVGRLSNDASFTVSLLEGGAAANYEVTIPKSGVLHNTDDNKTIADLLADINAALNTAGLAGKIEAVAEPIQGSTVSSRILLVAVDSDITRFQTVVATNNTAYTELGLRTQSASTVSLIAPKPIPAANPDANFNFTVTVFRTGDATGDATVINFSPSDTADNISLQSLINDLNAKLSATGIVASQNGGYLILSAVESDIEAFTVSDADQLGLDLTAMNDALHAAGVNELPTVLVAGVQYRGGAAPADPFGRLSADLNFTINGNAVQVMASDTGANTSINDLVRSINAAIEEGLDPDLVGKVAAINDGGRIAFRSIDASVQTITIAGLGLAESADLGMSNGSSAGGLAVRSSFVAPVSYGVSEDVAFTVTINGANYNATLTRDNTILNRSIYDLAASINNAINAAVGGVTKNPLIATVQSGQIVIGLKTSGTSTNLIGDPSTTTATGGIAPSAVTSFSINSANSKFASELKLISAANVANSASKVDFIIYFRDGTSANIVLDDLDSDGDQKLDKTLGELIQAIVDQSKRPDLTNRIQVEFNTDGTSLKLTDLTAGSSLFRVVAVNGSPAAAQLGILGSDTSNLNVGEVAVGVPVADGIIEGGKLANIDLRDRIYLKDAGASAELIIKTQGVVEAEATFGFVGIKLSSSADQTLFNATANLPIIDDAVSLRDLFSALGDSGDLLALVGGPTLTLAGDFSFNVSTSPDLSAVLDANVPGTAKVNFKTNTVVIDLSDQLPDPGQLFPDLGIEIEAIDFGDLLKFDQIKFDDVIQALQAIAEFLKQFESFDFLDDDIPVLGVSVNDLIDLADDFQAAVDEFYNNPAGGIQSLTQKIQEALGLPNFADLAARDAFFANIGIDPSSLPADLEQLIQFVIDGDVLRFDLRLPVGFNKGLNVDLDLGDALGTGDFVDIQGGANLAASGYLDAKLAFGIDLTDPTKLLIYDGDTGIFAGLSAGAQNVQFNAAIGPLGVFVKDGSIDLDLIAGVTVGDGNPTPEVIDLTDPGSLTAFLGTLNPTLSGSVDATLPVYFPSDSEYFGDITFAAGFALDGEGLSTTSPMLTVPDLSGIDLASLNPFNSIPQMLDALDFFLSGLQDILDGKVFNIELPLIGDQLQGAADFIDDLRRDVLGPIRQYAEQAPQLGLELVQKLLYSLLGSGSAGVTVASLLNPAVQQPLYQFLGLAGDFSGLGLLKDYNNDDGETTITWEDVVASVDPDNNFQWLFRLGQSFTPSVDVDFDLGIPALALDMDVGLDIIIDWDLALGLGIGPTDGAYIFIGDHRGNDSLGDNELEITLSVDLDQTSSITGNLGFLQLEIAESNTVDPKLEYSGPGTPPRNTFIAAQFGVDLINGSDSTDERLSFSELGNIGAEIVLDAEAEVNLDLVARFNPDIIPDTVQALLPEVSARFVLDWEAFNITSDAFDFADSLTLLGFRDVEIDMGSFINDFLKPFVDKIAEITEPLQPIIDVITAPIPVISDLAGQPISLVDIAGMTGYVEPAMIYAIADIISLVNKIGGGDYGTFTVPLGDFILLDTSVGSSLLTGSQLLMPGYSVAGDSQFDKDNLAEAVKKAQGDAIDSFSSLLNGGDGDTNSKDLVSGLTSGTEAGSSGFAFPLFDDPSLIFGLLLGKDIPIITYDLAPFGMDFSYTQKFPVWDALFVRIGGSVGLTIDLAFGYDTKGIREFADGGFSNPLDLLGGFYVSDTDQATGEGTDVPELVLKGELFAGAELNLGIASAGAEGVIGLVVDFDLYDPDSDGKVRIDELVGNFLYEFNYGSPLLAPIAIFDVTGEVYAQLRAFVEALFFKYEFEITPPITLFEFSIPFEREPFLATERGDGSLLLNIGPNAAQRLNGDTRDLGETIYVRSISDTEVEIWNGTTVKEGDAQRYKVTNGIFGYGGEGNDIIDLSQVTHNIVYTLEGGVGDDTIKGSAGGGSMKGDVGNDTLIGGSGIDFIYGGEGNDSIVGGAGNDFLFGDTGVISNLKDDNDVVIGDRIRSFVGAKDGDDHILGGAGLDIILGGGGNDFIEAGADNDIVLGDGGNFDRVGGQLQRLGPDQGNRLDINARGAGGKDTIFGNAGDDILFGGASDDLIDGGADQDEIDGGAGFDTIYGGSDADTIYGGSESDIIFGFRDPQGAVFGQAGDTADADADGIDTIYGEDGNDFIRGNDDNDTLYGGSGADILFGDKDDDHLYGEAGGDIMFGGADDDFIDGSDGADIVFGDDGLVVWFEFGSNAAFDFTGSRIRYVDGNGDGTVDQLIGDSDKTLRDAYKDSADNLKTSQDLIVTNTLATDGSDTIIGGDGKDIVFGGGGALDKLFGDFDPAAGFSGPRPSGQDILIGDGGRVELSGRRNLRAAAESGANDGNDQITGNDGGDYIFGGGFSDTIHGFQVDDPAVQPLEGVSDNDVILGDNGEIKFDISDALNRVKSINTTVVAGDSGRSDVIDGDFGNDIILGGLNGSSDVITGDVGDDVLLGDNGEVRFDLDGDFDTLDRIMSYADNLGGTDTISGNEGNDILIGGTAGDTMYGNDGEDILLGDNARIGLSGLTGRLKIQVAAMPAPSAIDFITTTDVAETTGGADVMSGNAGNDILFGGVNNGGVDTIYGDAAIPVNALDGDDILVGDNGFLDFTLGADTDRMTLDIVRSTRDNLGGTDTLSGNAGSDIGIGGTGGDTIYGDNATASGGGTDLGDVLLGDNADVLTAGAFNGSAKLKALGTGIALIKTTDTAENTGGIDTISGNAAADVILGGVAGDTLYGDASTPANGLDGNDVILGDNGELSFADDRDLALAPISMDLTTLDRITSKLDALGGVDTISGNAGQDTAMGGTSGDTIYGDNSTAAAGAFDLGDMLLGDNGEVILVNPALDAIANGADRILILGGAVASIKTAIDTAATGGADTISGNAGGDIVLGGVYGDTLYGDRSDVASTNALDGNDILLGDNGALEWLSTGRLDEVTGINLDENNPALVAGFASRDTNLDTLDLITTEQPTSGGRDLIFGDNGRDTIFGGTDADRLHGDSGDADASSSSNGNDLMFGDHGRLYPQFSRYLVGDSLQASINIYSRNFFAIDIDNTAGGEGDQMWGEEGHDIMLGQQGDDRMWGGSGDDDMIGGHNVSGGWDELDSSGAIDAVLDPDFDVNDLMDGGSGDDAMAGDNAIIWRRGDDVSPRFRQLTADSIYTTTEDSITANIASEGTGDPDDAVGRDIQLLDHSDAVQGDPQGRFGADVMAGGADSDVMFGQLDDDLMQGDGSIDTEDDGLGQFITRSIEFNDSGSNPYTDETLYFNIPELEADADDYMEGNGGNDLMYGGLGQDDMIGGSSALFGLITEEMRPDGADIIFGGAGVDISRNNIGDATEDGTTHVITTTATGHARDADFIMGDNANVYRLVGAGDSFRTFNYDNYTYNSNSGTYGLRIIPRAMEQLDYHLGGADYNAGTYVDGAAQVGDLAPDNGAGDLIHGESGDDIIFGMTGSDVIFGEGQDDDIVGGYGNDWISGGTGQDGILGDDGLIYTSRNSTIGESLYGVDGLLESDPRPKYADGNVLNEVIKTPGEIQYAVINVEGELKKTVDIVPFSYDHNWIAQDDEFPDNAANTPFADDIIFGGLGSDWLHGASGDDAISGAEALEKAYVPVDIYVDLDGVLRAHGKLDLGYDAFSLTAPINPGSWGSSPYEDGDGLAFNAVDLDGQHLNNRFRAGEFFLYDEYDPRRKILLDENGNLWKDASQGTAYEFLLNFDESEGVYRSSGTVPKSTGQQATNYPAVNDDGADKIFGDLGNDWLVGGTGRDNMYGGWGNDLLNADDDQDTNVNLNDQPDTHPTYEDRAYGGAGRDVLIANTGGDRLIDWVGEFNSYIVPFAPFGEATVSRTVMPFLPEFLYALSAGDGADPTRPAGLDPVRNGEPDGELGLVLQKDYAWQDQTGAPADPQAGNIPGGPRDVLRSAGFNDGTLQGFAIDSGVWEIQSGVLKVAAASLGKDAAAVFNVNDPLPAYFELLASVKLEKPTAGWKANSFILFDYQSETDFKFAGIDGSTNKLVMGHRTEAGWIYDVQTPFTVKIGTFYSMKLAVNGLNATLVVNNNTIFSYTYQARVIDGISYKLNAGMVGVGSNNARGSFDNIIVQILPPQYTFQRTEDFSDNAANDFSVDQGTWQVSGSKYNALANSGGFASSLMNFTGVDANSYLELSAVLNTNDRAGFVFDYYNKDDFKFVAIDADQDKLLIGHYNLDDGWQIDAVVAKTINNGVNYNLGITLHGSTVTVKFNGATALSRVYNSLLGDGWYGLFGLGAAGQVVGTFDNVTVKTDDAGYAQASVQSAAGVTALTASQSPSGSTETSDLATEQLQPLVQVAIAKWIRSGLIDEEQIKQLRQLNFEIGDLDGLALGQTDADSKTITVDINGAGYGWFIDRTPNQDREFVNNVASEDSDAYGKMDLLSVLIHEIGHYLGFDHDDSDVLALMDSDLDAGQRLELAHTDGNEVADDHRPALFFDEDSGVFVSQANKHAKKQHSIFEEDDEWLVV
jgi:Ca2+-binding RTX toxin-like protein